MAGGVTLEYTPTWVVAGVTTVIVVISLAVERVFHFVGKILKKKEQEPLFEAVQKIKEELMILGFISLLLTVFQNLIYKICIPENLAYSWMPCKKLYPGETQTTTHFQTVFSSSFPHTTAGRHLLAKAAASDPSAAHCIARGRLPLLSATALHHLHIFIFVLAVVHVTFCALTIIFGTARVRRWEEYCAAAKKIHNHPAEGIITVQEQDKNCFRSIIGKHNAFSNWIHSFCKHLYGSVTRSEYIILRNGFIKVHCGANLEFNFHRYMMRALEADFKKVVGIRWYLWIFVVLFLLVNVHGWHAYFWIAFVPFLLLLAVGTKLEHIIKHLVHEAAENKSAAIEEGSGGRNYDDYFWFRKPQLVLLLIRILLFQNSFEFAFMFWIWLQYGFDSCITGDIRYIIPRLVIGVFVQFVCSYSTLPLYAIVTPMGSSYKKELFKKHIQVAIFRWSNHAKSNAAKRTPNGSAEGTDKEYDSLSPSTVQLAIVGDQEATTKNPEN